MPESRKEKAISLFHERYNCAQSIFLAYSDMFDIDKETALKLMSGFGGGIAALGKTCGTITGAVAILGLKYGSADKDDIQNKMKVREIIRNFINEYEEKYEKTNCKELLISEDGKNLPRHSAKCANIVETVCDLLDKYLEND